MNIFVVLLALNHKCKYWFLCCCLVSKLVILQHAFQTVPFTSSTFQLEAATFKNQPKWRNLGSYLLRVVRSVQCPCFYVWRLKAANANMFARKTLTHGWQDIHQTLGWSVCFGYHSLTKHTIGETASVWTMATSYGTTQHKQNGGWISAGGVRFDHSIGKLCSILEWKLFFKK